MPQAGRPWTIFSSHGLVLFYLAANPEATQRAVSDALGLTERQVSRVVKDLEAAGMVLVRRQDRPRRNTYAVDPEARLRHPTLAHVPLRAIIAAVASELAVAVERPTTPPPPAGRP